MSNGIVVNNAAFQKARDSLTDIADDQLERTCATNILAICRVCRAALDHLSAQPAEIAPTYVFLASDEGRFYSGEVLAPTGRAVSR